jgi:transposase InsO family protein
MIAFIKQAQRILEVRDLFTKHEFVSIFNTDRGSQFTGNDFIEPLKKNGIAISMVG